MGQRIESRWLFYATEYTHTHYLICFVLFKNEFILEKFSVSPRKIFRCNVSVLVKIKIGIKESL